MRKYNYSDDLIGNRYGDWIVIGAGNQERKIKCKCLCGVCDSIIRDIDDRRLLSGKSNGCGKKQRRQNGLNNKRTNRYDLSGEFGIGWTRDDYEFYFDIEDYDRIKNYCWHRHQDGYLRTRIDRVNDKNIYILMHNLIFEKCDKNNNLDHINGKPFDNRKDNLRECTHMDNMKNVKLPSNNTSGIKGVYFSKRENKWKASIRFKNKPMHLGTFNTKEEAIDIRIKKEIELYGEYIRRDIEYGELYDIALA